MKTFAFLTALLMLTSCKSYNEFGPCIGISSEDARPGLVYKISVRNTIWSFIAFETIIAPVLWATDYAQCPVGEKK